MNPKRIMLSLSELVRGDGLEVEAEAGPGL